MCSSDLIDQMQGLLGRTLGEHIKFQTLPGKHLWHAVADAAQVESAIANLAVNARASLLLIADFARQVSDDGGAIVAFTWSCRPRTMCSGTGRGSPRSKRNAANCTKVCQAPEKLVGNAGGHGSQCAHYRPESPARPRP